MGRECFCHSLDLICPPPYKVEVVSRNFVNGRGRTWDILKMGWPSCKQRQGEHWKTMWSPASHKTKNKFKASSYMTSCQMLKMAVLSAGKL